MQDWKKKRLKSLSGMDEDSFKPDISLGDRALSQDDILDLASLKNKGLNSVDESKLGSYDAPSEINALEEDEHVADKKLIGKAISDVGSNLSKGLANSNQYKELGKVKLRGADVGPSKDVLTPRRKAIMNLLGR